MGLNVEASELAYEDIGMSVGLLTKALKETGKSVCVKEARRLEALPPSTSECNLHVRQAGLDVQDAVLIAQAMREFSRQNRVVIRSFSVSYNSGLQDAGVIALINAFPSTLTDLGLVGCDIGDSCGELLLEWAQSAPELRMVCLEQNSLSKEMRHRFSLLGEQRNDLFVVA